MKNIIKQEICMSKHTLKLIFNFKKYYKFLRAISRACRSTLLHACLMQKNGSIAELQVSKTF